jgi:general secretion pathway protein M
MNWFLAQSRRDQVALLICGLCVAVFLLWAAVVAPLANAREAANNRYRASTESLASVKTLAGTLQHLQASAEREGGQRNGSVEELVYEATRVQNMQMPNIKTGSGGAARINWDDIGADALLQWLYEVEVNRQAEISDINVSALRESGHVSAIITLRSQ